MPFRFSIIGNSLVIANTGVTPERTTEWFLTAFHYYPDQLNQTISFTSRDSLGTRGSTTYSFLDSRGNINIFDEDDTAFPDFDTWLQFIRDNAGFNQVGGWAFYGDTQFTSGAPFALPAATPTVMPNNAGVIDESQLPPTIPSLYNPGTLELLGRENDSLILGVRFIGVPSAVGGTIVFFIDDTVNSLYVGSDDANVFAGVPTPMSYMVPDVIVSSDWAANGGQVTINGTIAFSLFDIQYTIKALNN